MGPLKKIMEAGPEPRGRPLCEVGEGSQSVQARGKMDRVYNFADALGGTVTLFESV